MKIQVVVKNVFGLEKVYPICEKAKLLCELAGTVTFTDQAISTCKKLGYEFEQIPSYQRKF